MVYLVDVDNIDINELMKPDIGVRLYFFDTQSACALLKSCEWQSGIRKQSTAELLSVYLGVDVETNETPITLNENDLLLYVVYVRPNVPINNQYSSKFILIHIEKLTPVLKELVL